MAILNPDHLFEQAEALISPGTGRPRQVDVRRAVSAAYYALFHAIITAATDQFIGVTNRDESRYGLVYRSVGHGWLRDLCEEIQKQTLHSKFRRYEPSGSASVSTSLTLRAAVVEPQEKRYAADYDVMVRMNRLDATIAIAQARAALGRFDTASQTERLAFLSLLLFPPRN